MTISKKTILGAFLALMVAVPFGVSMAATSFTKEQITQEVTKDHPGSQVEHAVLGKHKEHKAWVVTIKDADGKMQTLYYNPTTGKPLM
ncbi:MAG: PepSY domain-containing protein [Gammaproteobacteria bacterium]|nr:PepSY domain-containing protein [Gammaproteobacteria bacterium]